MTDNTPGISWQWVGRTQPRQAVSIGEIAVSGDGRVVMSFPEADNLRITMVPERARWLADELERHANEVDPRPSPSTEQWVVFREAFEHMESCRECGEGSLNDCGKVAEMKLRVDVIRQADKQLGAST